MNIGALIIGDELLSGKRQDQHFQYLQSVLAQRGLELSWTIIVGDEAEQLERFLSFTLATKDLAVLVPHQTIEQDKRSPESPMLICSPIPTQ